jgi:O-antigen ligase
MRIILYSMFLAVAMVSVFGAINIISFFKTNLPVGERDFFFFGNANPFASYLNLIIPVILGMMMVSALLWERIVLGALAFLSIIVWVLTFSKSSYLSFLLSIALVLFLAKSKKRVLLVLATFFAIFAITLLFSDIREALMDRVGLQTLLISLGFRAECYSAGFNMVRDGLVFGIGIGSYPFYIMKFSTNSYITQHHLHSLYLQIFVETGFLGISAFVFWLVCIIKYLVNSLKPLEDFRHYWLFVGLMGGVIAYLFSNFTDVLVVHGIHLQWGIMLGLAVVLIQFREKEKCPEMV